VGERSFIGRCRLVRNPKTISIGHHTTLCDGWCLTDLNPSTGRAHPKIRIGSYCNILYDFHCNASLSVEIQDYVLIAPRVFITDSDHVVGDRERTTMSNEFRSAPVTIEHDCWLGVGCVVLKGVTIGHHSIIGANAVVTRSVAPFSTVVGVPGRNIKQKENLS
jgi:acetyltransferase-like isoleucine patch superfamily enzyme